MRNICSDHLTWLGRMTGARRLSVPLAVMLPIYSAYAQQPKAAYTFKPLVATGATIAGHSFSASTLIDGLALNDSGDICFVAGWPEAGKQRTAVFTANRMVLRDGDVIDKKPITHISATALAINAPGHCAFEATYGEGQLGIFVNRTFNVALSVSGAPNDFTLSDDDHITRPRTTNAASQLFQTASSRESRPRSSVGCTDRIPRSEASIPM